MQSVSRFLLPSLPTTDEHVCDAIGGQGFVIKLRPTEERSTSAMLLEPPFEYNGTGVYASEYPRWRHMKYVHVHSELSMCD